MADNVKVKPSTDGTAVNVATDEIGALHYPIYKTAFGAADAVTQVDASNPLPVVVDPTIPVVVTIDTIPVVVDCFALAMGEIYNDGTWKYFGEAAPGSAVGASVWRISRLNITSKKVEWADGDSDFDNPYTDENTVTNIQSYS